MSTPTSSPPSLALGPGDASDLPGVVLRFLESVGRKSEAEFYVQLFRAEPKERFAAISVDANVARHATDAVVLHLKFLANLGLAPVVVLGLFEPTDASEHAARIVRRLSHQSVLAEIIDPEDAHTLPARITAACRSNKIPVVAFAFAQGQSADERFLRLAELLGRLETHKLIFLHRPGGLRQKGALLPLVNLSKDYHSLLSSKELSRKERAILVQSFGLVANATHKLVVTITSPLNLLRELFTVKGAGTLLRRGASIQRFSSYSQIDGTRLRGLIANSFGRTPSDQFFERPVLAIYLEEQYHGCAILSASPFGAYLTKFATDREARGEGIARDLWEVFSEEHPAVFWRARVSNPINEWYTKLADGLLKTPDWWIFWKGIPSEKIHDLVQFALAQPVDLPPPAPDTPATMP